MKTSLITSALSLILVLVCGDRPLAQEADPVVTASELQNEVLEERTEIRTFNYFITDAGPAMLDLYEQAHVRNGPPWFPEKILKDRSGPLGWIGFIESLEQLAAGKGLVLVRHEKTKTVYPGGLRHLPRVRLTIVLPETWRQNKVSGSWNQYEIKVGGQDRDNAFVFWSYWAHYQACYAFATSGSVKFRRDMMPFKYIDGVGIRPYPDSEQAIENIFAELDLTFSRTVGKQKPDNPMGPCYPFTLRDLVRFFKRELSDIE